MADLQLPSQSLTTITSNTLMNTTHITRNIWLHHTVTRKYYCAEASVQCHPDYCKLILVPAHSLGEPPQLLGLGHISVNSINAANSMNVFAQGGIVTIQAKEIDRGYAIGCDESTATTRWLHVLWTRQDQDLTDIHLCVMLFAVAIRRSEARIRTKYTFSGQQEA